ncbi:MAG: DUF3850 domain-containing protein [Armatimonadota bacterium]
MRETIIHELKTIPPYFEAVWKGDKTAELRKNDRGFAVGDTLVLREYIPGSVNSSVGDGYHTGRAVVATVTHLTDYPPALQANCVMISFKFRCQFEGYEAGDAQKKLATR